MVFPAGFEPTAPELGILCSILLSYGNTQRPFYIRMRKDQKKKLSCGVGELFEGGLVISVWGV